MYVLNTPATPSRSSVPEVCSRLGMPVTWSTYVSYGAIASAPFASIAAVSMKLE